MRPDEITRTLRNPRDRAGWEQLLRLEDRRITMYLLSLGRQTGWRSAADLADIKQTALLRIILESRRIRDPTVYWTYWRRILRSCFFDFLRVEGRTATQEIPDNLPDPSADPTARDIERVLRSFREGSTALGAAVLDGLLTGEAAADTARRLSTSRDTIYAIRSRIRNRLRRLGVGV